MFVNWLSVLQFVVEPVAAVVLESFLIYSMPNHSVRPELCPCQICTIHPFASPCPTVKLYRRLLGAVQIEEESEREQNALEIRIIIQAYFVEWAPI